MRLRGILLVMLFAAGTQAQTTLFPENLIAYTAEIQGSVVNIAWSTSCEVNISSYSIERSTDGIFFTERLTVPAAGTSSVQHDYQCSDKNENDTLCYYRLRAISADGTSGYSRIVAVQQSASRFSIFPNPSASGEIHLSIPAQTEVLITGPTGRTIFRKQYTEAGVYTVSLEQYTGLSRAGIYYVHFTGRQSTEVRRLICQ